MNHTAKTATAGEHIGGGERTPRESSLLIDVQKLAALLDVNALARMLGCSARHVYRLCDSGRMPRPVKLGALNRWQREAIENWVRQGCPSLRKAGTR